MAKLTVPLASAVDTYYVKLFEMQKGYTYTVYISEDSSADWPSTSSATDRGSFTVTGTDELVQTVSGSVWECIFDLFIQSGLYKFTFVCQYSCPLAIGLYLHAQYTGYYHVEYFVSESIDGVESDLTGNFIPVIKINGELTYLSTVPYNMENPGIRFMKNSQIQTARLYDLNAVNGTNLRIKLNDTIYQLGTMPDGIIAAACKGESNSDKNKTYIFQFKNNSLELLTMLSVHVNSLGYIPNFHIFINSYEVHGSGGRGLNVWTSLNIGTQISFDGKNWIENNDCGHLYYCIFGKERIYFLGNRYNNIKKRTQWVVYECKNDKFTEVQVVSDSDYLLGSKDADNRYNLIGFDFNLNFYFESDDYRYSDHAYRKYVYVVSEDYGKKHYLGYGQDLGYETTETVQNVRDSLYRINDITNGSTNLLLEAPVTFTTTLTNKDYTLTGKNSIMTITGNGVNQSVSVSPRGTQSVTVAKITYDNYNLGVGD